MKVEIRKTFKFEMGHQLSCSYTTGCQNLHGHSYVLEVFLKQFDESEKLLVLDKYGMVIDFGEIKDAFKEYIDEYDHALVMPNTFPPEYIDMLKKYNHKVVIKNYNPTAENMAQDILINLIKIVNEKFIDKNIYVSKVRLHETTTGFAEVCV